MTTPANYTYRYDTDDSPPDEPHSNANGKKARSNGRRPKLDDTNIIVPLNVFDLADLLHEEFEPLQWIIPDYLPEGLTLLFSRPKVGKSMLSLALSLRMARRVSGGVDGTVLYLTLDDTNKRRMQSRTRSLLQGEEIEKGHIWAATQSQTLDTNLIGQLDHWLEAHTDTRLIVIDVYARIKPKKQDDDVYKSDYNALVKLQEFAVEQHIAILLVHHTRKQADTGDWIDSINGSTGLSAAVDTLWFLERKPHSNDLRLRVKGRDTMGELAVLLSLDDLDAPWKLEDEEEVDVNDTEQKILIVLTAANGEMKPKQITEQTGLKHVTIRSALRRMLHKNLVACTTYGSYRVAELQEKNTCNSATLDNDIATEEATQAEPQRVAEELQNDDVAILDNPLYLRRTCFKHGVESQKPVGKRLVCTICNPVYAI